MAKKILTDGERLEIAVSLLDEGSLDLYTEECEKEESKNGPKKCFNYCPKCGATDPDIAWGDKDWGDTHSWQNATCKKCGCMFTEVYEYANTEIDDLG